MKQMILPAAAGGDDSMPLYRLLLPSLASNDELHNSDT